MTAVGRAHAVVDQPEYEPGRLLLVCEAPEDADHFRGVTGDRDVIVVPTLYVPAGARAAVFRQQVWTLTVSVEPGGDGQWYPGAVYSRSDLEWRADDPPAEAMVERISRTAMSKPDKYVVRATGATPHTTNLALQEKLGVLLGQLADGTLP
jgi:hypothetical protein